MHAVRVGRSLGLPDSVLPVLLHHEGFIIWQSHGLARLLGRYKAGLRGRSVLRFVTPECAPRAEAVLHRPHLPSRLRLDLLHANGTKIPVEVRGEPAVVEGLEVRRVVVRVVEDIPAMVS